MNCRVTLLFHSIPFQSALLAKVLNTVREHVHTAITNARKVEGCTNEIFNSWARLSHFSSSRISGEPYKSRITSLGYFSPRPNEEGEEADTHIDIAGGHTIT